MAKDPIYPIEVCITKIIPNDDLTILCTVICEMRKHGISEEEIQKFRYEASSEGSCKLLDTCAKYVIVS